MQVESIRNIFTFASVTTGWSSTSNFTDSTKTSANITLSQSLGNGQYEATIKLNASSTDVKRQSIWFEIKDFDAIFYTAKWGYSSSDPIELIAQGLVSNSYVAVNVSNSSGSPELVVYRYDKATWAKTQVTGITVSTQMNQSSPLWPLNGTKINLTKSGGWDEGSYEVMANLTRVNSAGVATGSKVEVHSWFDVRLFDAWGWSESWSNHPKGNVTLHVHVGVSGNWWQNYNGVVSANVTAITNTQTGAVLTAGTDYGVKNHTANPSTVGDLNLTIITLGSGLAVGSYRATVQVTDSTTGKYVTTDVWFEVKAFQFYAYAERYEYASSDNVVFILNVYSPTGSNITLTDGRINYLSKCTTSTCSTVSLSSINTSFNATSMRLTILNSSGLATGWYWAELQVNDTQNAFATSGAGFQIKSFGISGYVQYPGNATSSRWYNYINESVVLNVTGTVGTNVTNATFSYWICTGTCIYKKLEIKRTTGIVVILLSIISLLNGGGFVLAIISLIGGLLLLKGK
jgi:hypothetical protein